MNKFFTSKSEALKYFETAVDKHDTCIQWYDGGKEDDFADVKISHSRWENVQKTREVIAWYGENFHIFAVCLPNGYFGVFETQVTPETVS